MAERLAAGDYDQLHRFIAAGIWDAKPVETELLVQADKLVGGSDAVLVIDDRDTRRRAFGGCRCAVLLGAGQDRELPEGIKINPDWAKIISGKGKRVGAIGYLRTLLPELPCLAAARLLADNGVHKVQGGGVVIGEAYALSHLASLLHAQVVAVA